MRERAGEPRLWRPTRCCKKRNSRKNFSERKYLIWRTFLQNKNCWPLREGEDGDRRSRSHEQDMKKDSDEVQPIMMQHRVITPPPSNKNNCAIWQFDVNKGKRWKNLPCVSGVLNWMKKFTVCIMDWDSLVKIGCWLFLCHFWPLLNWTIFFEGLFQKLA